MNNCPCGHDCSYLTPPAKTVFEQECPELMNAILSANSEDFIHMVFLMLSVSALYDERGRVGLREAEERFKENKIDLYELFKKENKNEQN